MKEGRQAQRGSAPAVRILRPGGHSGTEGGRTRGTYFAPGGGGGGGGGGGVGCALRFREGPHPRYVFRGRRVLFCTQVRSTGVKIPLQSTKYTRL